ncbi:hypothetical protein [Streptomyces sp. NBC_01304]|uniref:hypothetical protein n=1 Tax=Streptomyces sp. NBC_01304 TaxID=2903818 RepID=UPI002E15A04A|nr:hypothetical protein OG430_44480 [Streptomyces sp. NBC_01304]
MTARLIDTGPICYLSPGTGLVWRPCRTWETEHGDVVSVVTETSEPTRSIESAADEIRRGLTSARPWADPVRIIEHWPTGTGAPDEEHYAEQLPVPGGGIRWEHRTPHALAELLGPTFELTKPDATPVDGIGPIPTGRNPW